MQRNANVRLRTINRIYLNTEKDKVAGGKPSLALRIWKTLTEAMKLWPIAALVLGTVLLGESTRINDTRRTDLQQIILLTEALKDEDAEYRRAVSQAILQLRAPTLSESKEESQALPWGPYEWFPRSKPSQAVEELAQSILAAAQNELDDLGEKAPPQRILSLAESAAKLEARAAMLSQDAEDLIISGTGIMPTSDQTGGIALVVGHNLSAQGAAGAGITEFTLGNSLAACIESEVRSLGHRAMKFNREATSGFVEEINNVMKKVGAWKPSLTLMLHFNYAPTSAARGSEAFIYKDADQAVSNFADSLLKALEGNGFPYRGVKPLDSGQRASTAILAAPSAAVLLETFFLSNSADVIAFHAAPLNICQDLARNISEELNIRNP